MAIPSQTYLDKYRQTRLRDLANFDRGHGKWGTVIGIDEVGVGALSGPLVACALILKSYKGLLGVDDSKALSSRDRRHLAYKNILPQIHEAQLSFIPAVEVDELNVAQAAHVARNRAFAALGARESARIVLVDGDDTSHVFEGLKFRAIVKGDSKSLTIAAASIIAKVTRDKLMDDLGQAYPYYGWNTNAGYGTKPHIEAIKKHGLSPYHRLTFDPNKTAARIERGERKLQRKAKAATMSLRRAAKAHTMRVHATKGAP